MKRWIFLIALVGALGFLIAWRLEQNHAAVVAQAQQRQMMMKKPPVVSVAVAQVRDIVHSFSSVGNVESPENVRIASKVTGRILYLQAQPGDHVIAGELLVRIDPSQVQAQVQQQQAALAAANANYNQVRGNYAAQVEAALSAVADARGKVSSATAAEGNARAAIATAQANFRNAQAQYNR
ncbi:MAG: biotin/lipoyl-binding protein, partial [Chloroflexi bacterium]|nr:biotin/lipoyl-binding protein [Chloroflexota bacterium]